MTGDSPDTTHTSPLYQVGRLERLEALDLRRCGLVCDASLAAFAEAATGGGLGAAGRRGGGASNGCRLTSLDIAGCASVGDAGVLAVARACPRLRRLRLRGHPGLTDNGVQALSRGCSRLERLSLRDCARVGDRGAATICARLRRLKVCVGAADLGVRSFVNLRRQVV